MRLSSDSFPSISLAQEVTRICYNLGLWNQAPLRGHQASFPLLSSPSPILFFPFPLKHTYESTQAAFTKHHRWGDSDNRNLFLSVLKARSLRSGCQCGQTPVTAFLQTATFCWVLCPWQWERVGMPLSSGNPTKGLHPHDPIREESTISKYHPMGGEGFHMWI